MASTNPVPSRAALNALRGVVFTTSCSVILLAEERRRRLKIARSAIDNARKLHTVRGNRGPIALTDSHGSWESRYSDISDEVLALSSGPRPRTSTRRRKRSQLIGSVTEGDYEISVNEPLSGSHANGPAGSSLAGQFASELDAASTRSARYEDHDRTRDAHLEKEWKKPLSFLQAKAVAATDNGRSTIEPPAGRRKEQLTTDTVENRKGDSSFVNKKLDSSIESADTYLRKSSYNSRVVARPFYDDAVVALEQLLSDLETDATDPISTSQKLDRAFTILERVSTFGVPLPKAAKALHLQGTRLFSVVAAHQSSELSKLLPPLLLMSKDCLKVLLPFMEYAQARNSPEVARKALELLSQQRERFGWKRGTLILGFLSRYAKRQQVFEPCKQLYRLLQECGMFRDFDLPQATEYQIRRLMATLALADGDDGFARQELRQLHKIDSGVYQADGTLQMAITSRKAKLGLWAEVFPEIRALNHSAGADTAAFQAFLIRITDLFQSSHSPEQLERYLRQVVPECHLHIKSRWVFVVLDSLARRRQAEPLFNWLQFCRNAGLQMNQAFSEKFLVRCRKYWSFSEKTTSEMAEQLGIHSWNDQLATRTANLGRHSRTLYDQLDALVSSEQYKLAADIYDAARNSGEGATVECLRFAVLAHLKGDTPDVAKAIELVGAAKEEGCDVSEALTPLLMSRLDKGDDPHWLIDEALQMGARVHDSAYNRAAQTLSATGNHQAAAHICHVAAQQNGSGNLLYNEYNFANLVFAYTGLASYRALKSLLSGFTSEMQWWHGSRRCKESIKLAMKTTAMRAVAHSHDSSYHREALHNLDDALLHVKRCRATREHRRAITEAYVRIAKGSTVSEGQRVYQRTKPALRVRSDGKGHAAAQMTAPIVHQLVAAGASE